MKNIKNKKLDVPTPYQSPFANLFTNLPVEIQKKVVDLVFDTSAAWQTNTTLSINGVVLQQEGTVDDYIAIALITHLGHVSKITLTPYLITWDERPCWGVARPLVRISKQTNQEI